MRCWPLIVVLLGGCKQLPKMPDLKEVLPEVRFSDLKVEQVDFKGMDGRFVLEVDNPYPLELKLSETSWKLGLAGHPFLDGTNEEGLAIAPAETSKVRIPFGLKWRNAFDVVTDAKGKDALPFSLDATLGFETPIGPVSVPLKHDGDLPALHAPKIALKGLRVEKLDLLKQTASLALDLGLSSDQGSALTFETFGYGISLAGIDVASGDTKIGAVEGQKDVTLPIDLKLLNLGKVVVDAVTKKTRLEVRLKADANVGTPLGTIPLAIDELADLAVK